MRSPAARSDKRVAYPAYKPSGVSWLGEIPAHWDPVRLRYRAKINPIRSEINGLPGTLDVSFVPMESVHEYGGLSLDQSRPLAEVSTGYTYFRDGDVLAAKITPCFENGKGAIAHELMNGIGFGTTELHVLRPHPSMDRHFLFYVTISHAFRHLGAAEMYGAGGQKRVPEIFIRDFRQSIPPLKEQRTIAAFLDHETARIDALIKKKQRQIELLQEKRLALITQAVTKGLDPDAKMKDSGVEWIGSIPAQWEVKRLKFVVSEPLKYGANEAAELDDPELPRYIRITDVDENGRLRDETFKSIPEDVARPYMLKEGDLLLARSGATVGKSFYYEPSWGRAAYAGYLIRARFDPTKTMPRFINYFTNSQQYWQWLGSSFIQATIQNVSAEKYANLIVPVPPFEEQKRIVSYLDSMWQRLNNMADKVRQSIQILKEYRSALISAAVTGKIDVRKEVS
ncbi:conserved hypothetical protein [uncultured Desulfatiglans sp.]|nr:conserved hypothetical protein [uncultured Desulfatiglans sp.]